MSEVNTGPDSRQGFPIKVGIDRTGQYTKVKKRRWVVEVCHSWFNRFRKLLVRYEKLEHAFLALNHLAAAINRSTTK